MVGENNDEAVDARDNLAVWLFRLITALDSLTTQLRRSLSLNEHERLAIASTWAEGPMTMSQLGSAISLSRAAVTTLVDRLEQYGYLERSASKKDRRETLVRVCPEAIGVISPLIRPWMQDMQELACDLPDNKWIVVQDFVDAVCERSLKHTSLLKNCTDEQLQLILCSEDT